MIDLSLHQTAAAVQQMWMNVTIRCKQSKSIIMAVLVGSPLATKELLWAGLLSIMRQHQSIFSVLRLSHRLLLMPRWLRIIQRDVSTNGSHVEHRIIRHAKAMHSDYHLQASADCIICGRADVYMLNIQGNAFSKSSLLSDFFLQADWLHYSEASAVSFIQSVGHHLLIDCVIGQPKSKQVDMLLSNPAEHSRIVIIYSLFPVTLIRTALEDLKHRWWWETKQVAVR